MLKNLTLAAEFGTGQVFWSILWLFLFFVWFWLIITVFADIIRARNMSGWSKAFWLVLIIITPYIGVFIYLIANGGKMQDRAVKQFKEQQEASEAYIRSVAGSGSSIADELKNLAELKAAGVISDDEFERAKAKLIG